MNKYILKIDPSVSDSPLVAEVVLETGVLVNILKAKIDYHGGDILISIEADEERQKKVVDALIKRGVKVSRLRRAIANEVNKCVSCGACISLCPTSAISFDSDWNIKIDGDKCIRCRLCVDACPRRSLSIKEI